MKRKKGLNWLEKHKRGAVIGASAGLLLGFINVFTGNGILFLGVPGFFFGGLFVGGFGPSLFGPWFAALSVVLNIVFLGLLGAWIESIISRR